MRLHYSSVKYDTTKTIMSKDAHNIEKNSMLEHKSPCINNVCTTGGSHLSRTAVKPDSHLARIFCQNCFFSFYKLI